MEINSIRFPANKIRSDLLKSVYSNWNKPLIDEGKSDNKVQFNPAKEFFGSVNSMQNKAEQSAIDFSLGEAENIHRAVIDVEESLLATKLMVHVRNKAVEAYQEIMRMQV